MAPKLCARVFDHRQAVLFGDGVDGVHVGALAVQADRHDGLGLGTDGVFDQIRIEVVGARVDVDEHRCGAEQGDRLGGGDEAEGGGDDLVAGADLQRHQGHDQGVGAARGRDAVANADIVGQPFLHLADLGAEDVLAVVHDRGDAPVEIFADQGLLGFEVDELNGKSSRVGNADYRTET